MKVCATQGAGDSKALFDDDGLCYQELDENGIIVHVNQAWLEATGLSLDEALGLPISGFVEQGSYPKIDRHLPILKSHGEINHVRFNFLFKHQQFREVLLFGRAEFDEQGHFIKTNCWFAPLDYFIASPQRFQKFLHQVESIQTHLTDQTNFLEWVFNSVESLLVVVQNGKIVRANAPFLKFCQLPLDADISLLNCPVTRTLSEVIKHCTVDVAERVTTLVDLVNPADQKIHHFECKMTPASYVEGEQIALLTDITQQHLFQERLKQEEARSRSYLQVARVMMVALDTHGVVTMINQKGCETLGYLKSEIIGRNWFELAVPSERRAKDESYFLGILDGALEDTSDYISHIQTCIGEQRLLAWRSVTVFDEHHLPAGVLSSAEDITEIQASHDRMKYMAMHDALTDLPNRTCLYLELDDAIQRAKERKKSLAVGFIDLDNFKPINDLYGHKIGDKVLIATGRRMQNLIRKRDTLCRFGGDEFVFVLEDYGDEFQLERIGQKLLDSLLEPFHFLDQQHQVSISLGFSVYPRDGEDATQLIENADTAMYQVKREGKNHFGFYDHAIREQQKQRLEMQFDLKTAVEQSQFTVYYQPQINNYSKEVVGLEALIRWQHPDKGFIAPDKFIPLAEELKLIIPIGEQVLRQACLDVKMLHDKLLFNGYVAVNVSGVQIDSDQFLQTVHKVLDETQVSPTLLEMEITESVVMSNPDQWIALFKNLKSIGLRIAIDDFGKGYSSLTHLSDLPLDKLKIDMSFVKGLPHDPKACAIAQSIIDLSQNMGMVSLAEGIEKPEQHLFLQQQQCDVGQGYLFAKPMPIDELENWLAQHSQSLIKALA